MMRLCGEVGRLRSDARELKQINTNVARQHNDLRNTMTDLFTRSLGPAQSVREKQAMRQLDRMKESLGLSTGQEEAIRQILLQNIRANTDAVRQSLAGKLTPEQMEQHRATVSHQATAIQALLNTEQQAAYAQYKNTEAMTEARQSTETEMAKLKNSLNLLPEQCQQFEGILYEWNLRQKVNPTPDLTAFPFTQERLSQQILQQKEQLETKLQAFQAVITPEQLANYRQQQTAQIDQQAEMMKAVIPP